MPKRPADLSKTEWSLMNIIWKKGKVSARDVYDETLREKTRGYQTVKTMLDRLVDKGVLTVRKRANTSLYEPTLSRDAARHSAVRSLVDRAFDGAFGSLVQHIVAEEELSDADREALGAMLGELDGAEESDR